jgi:hypothetical protein
MLIAKHGTHGVDRHCGCAGARAGARGGLLRAWRPIQTCHRVCERGVHHPHRQPARAARVQRGAGRQACLPRSLLWPGEPRACQGVKLHLPSSCLRANQSSQPDKVTDANSGCKRAGSLQHMPAKPSPLAKYVCNQPKCAQPFDQVHSHAALIAQVSCAGSLVRVCQAATCSGRDARSRSAPRGRRRCGRKLHYEPKHRCPHPRAPRPRWRRAWRRQPVTRAVAELAAGHACNAARCKHACVQADAGAAAVQRRRQACGGCRARHRPYDPAQALRNASHRGGATRVQAAFTQVRSAVGWLLHAGAHSHAWLKEPSTSQS